MEKDKDKGRGNNARGSKNNTISNNSKKHNEDK